MRKGWIACLMLCGLWTACESMPQSEVDDSTMPYQGLSTVMDTLELGATRVYALSYHVLAKDQDAEVFIKVSLNQEKQTHSDSIFEFVPAGQVLQGQMIFGQAYVHQGEAKPTITIQTTIVQ